MSEQGGELERHPIRLCDHPRASRQIELVRAWAGIGAFAVVAFLSHRAGVPAFQTGVRALGAGVVSYMAAWALTVLVWRHLVLAEAKAAQVAAEERRSALLEEIERRSRQTSNAA